MRISIAIVVFIVCLSIMYIVFRDPLEDVIGMGHMRYWWIFGFEIWGKVRPERMWRNNGDEYTPLFLGIWIRQNCWRKK
jgi:hypothetical protein